MSKLILDGYRCPIGVYVMSEFDRERRRTQPTHTTPGDMLDYFVIVAQRVLTGTFEACAACPNQLACLDKPVWSQQEY
jgi:hypothetical protein